MKVDVGRIRPFNPDLWRSQARKWRVNASQSRTAATDLRDQAAAARAAWNGPVGEAMAQMLEAQAGQLDDQATLYESLADTLGRGADEMAKIQEQLKRLEEFAKQYRLKIEDNNSVVPDPEQPKPDVVLSIKQAAVTPAISTRISIMCLRATVIDQTVAAALAQRANVTFPIPADSGPIDMSDEAIRRTAELSQQGGLGDCAWLATLRTIAQANPETLRKNCVWDPTTQTYKVTLWDESGKPHEVFVDPDALADASSNPADPSKVNILQIYEQALLQVDPTFPSIHFNGATQMITGHEEPVQRTNDVDTQTIRQTLEKQPPGGAMVATTRAPEEQPQDVPANKRLVPGHAYSVKSVDADGNITLANPWGPQGANGYPGVVTLTPDEYRRWLGDVTLVQNP